MSGTFDAAMPPTAETAAFDTTPAATAQPEQAVPGAEIPGADLSPPEPAPADPTAASPPADQAPEDPAAILHAAIRLAEAMVFASADPVTPRALGQVLPDSVDAAAVLAALRERYAGRGVELVEVAGGFQFRTAADLSPALRKIVVVPRRLPRVAMETLAIIAYHQPVTRPEIEEMRGASLSQQTLDALLEADLVAPKGRKEAPGRPTLWGTTPNFLAQFGLRDLRELPRREDLLVEPAIPTGMPATLGPGQPDTAPTPTAPDLIEPDSTQPDPTAPDSTQPSTGTSVPVPPESC